MLFRMLCCVRICNSAVEVSSTGVQIEVLLCNISAYSRVRVRGYIQKFPDWVDNETTTINTYWEATQRVIAINLTRLTHKIAIQLHLVAESCTICICCSRRPVRKLLVTLSYTESCVGEFRYVCSHPPVTCRMHEIGSIPSYSSVKYCAVCTCTLNKGEKCSWVGRAFQIRLVGSLRTLWL